MSPGGPCRRAGRAWASGSGGWTADGRVIYNINNDGKGDMVWSLTGSPSIS